MRIPLYQVDAFTDRPFGGNPAALCPLERWLEDELMQAIAAENNLAETAFFVPAGAQDGGADYALRWFTPALEVDLCGHATLAAAHVIFTRLEPARTQVAFATRSGRLEVARDGDRLALDFPSEPPEPCDGLEAVAAALGARPKELLKSRYGLARFGSEAKVAALKPDFARVKALDLFAVIATAPGAPGSGVDFVSRFFAPKAGIDEDPVTGSSHCALIPYWSKRLGKPKLFARQISPRGGALWCEDRGGRVAIAGQCVEVIEGTISLPDK
ncbi:MAG TPA: PhzF family phenazine biosynthesis protein [Alphaproteobacteria bacterium]|nr:PhzF family phenazine biosynthesis protein [Alphaproteobacteria bacterium]